MRPKGTGTIGVDLGVKHTAVTFDGVQDKVFDLPGTYDKAQRAVDRCQRNLSTKVEGSKRYAKAKLKLQCAYAHEAAIRKDFLNKFTTWLVSSFDTIKVDDFSFKGFVTMQTVKVDGVRKHKKRKAKAVRKAYSVAPYMLKCMLENKAAERGNVVIYVPTGTPTTKTCSHCGKEHQVALSERTYECPYCGFIADRDVNAAINVYNY